MSSIIIITLSTITILLSMFAIRWVVKELYKPSYYDKCRRLQNKVRSIKGGFVRKHSNHTYRGESMIKDRKRINMKDFTDIISYNVATGVLEVEGNIKIKNAIKFLLTKNRNLAACPDLKELTLGGIVSGVGGGNTSFRTGYFHNQVIELDLLLPSAEIKTLTPNDELFKAIPRSMGTLGYITRMKLKTVQAKPYVRSNIYHFSNPKKYYDKMRDLVESPDIQFLDATVFSKNQLIIVTGTYVDSAPTLVNVANKDIYYEEIQKEKVMYFKTYEFIYRFSTDLYYTTLSLPKWLRSKGLRRCIPKGMIEPIQHLIGKFLPVDIGKICQDVLIPADHAHEFFEWYDVNVGLYPLYNVPARSPVSTALFWKDTRLYIDFGIGYGVRPPNPQDEDIMCKEIEQKMLTVGGVKLPYTNTHMSIDEFWNHFGTKEYEIYKQIRKQYGSTQLPTIYEKIANR